MKRKNVVIEWIMGFFNFGNLLFDYRNVYIKF